MSIVSCLYPSRIQAPQGLESPAFSTDISRVSTVVSGKKWMLETHLLNE